MTDYQVPTIDEREHSRDRYIAVQRHGIDRASSWIRNEAAQISGYASSLAATRSRDPDMIASVRGSIGAARLALTEALLAVRLAENEFNRATAPKLQAAE